MTQRITLNIKLINFSRRVSYKNNNMIKDYSSPGKQTYGLNDPQSETYRLNC